MELSGVMQFDDLIIHEENIQEEAVDLVLKLRPQWKKDEIKVTVSNTLTAMQINALSIVYAHVCELRFSLMASAINWLAAA